MDREYLNKSELLLPLFLFVSILKCSPPEIVDLTDQELITLGFLGDSELLSSLHTRPYLS